MVIRCLCDGVSIRATARISGTGKNAIHKLTRDLGRGVLQYHDNVLRNLPCKRLELMFFYHNFCRVHQTLKTTPAVAAALATRKWSVEEMVDLLPIVSYNTRPKRKKTED